MIEEESSLSSDWESLERKEHKGGNAYGELESEESDENSILDSEDEISASEED